MGDSPRQTADARRLSLPVFFLPAAEADLREAQAWYDSRAMAWETASLRLWTAPCRELASVPFSSRWSIPMPAERWFADSPMRYISAWNRLPCS